VASLLPVVALATGCAGFGDAPRADTAAPADIPPAVVAPESAADEAAPTIPTGSFAYPHADGRQLLAVDSLFPPTAVRWAICPGAVVLPVRHAGRQPGDAGDTGRQHAANFVHQAGERFVVTAGRAAPDASCYLTADSVLATAVLPPAATKAPVCPPALRARLAEAEARAVQGCWPLPAVAPGVTVALAQFVTGGREALAVMAVLDHDTLRLDRHPATVERLGQDLWRVDDQGVFHPEDFRVLFAARRSGALVVAVSWMGAEGENLVLLAPGVDPRGEAPLSGAAWGRWHRGYRYLAPA
jgi:hypothetical protein